MARETFRRKFSACLCIVVACQVTLTASAAAEAVSEADLFARAQVTEIWQPVPITVSVNSMGVPSDALVLFRGGVLDQWRSVAGGTAPWRVDGDSFTVEPGTGDIETVEHFTDVQLHIEWRAPVELVGDSQGRGNSGVFLMRDYEVQVLDSYNNPTYSNGQAASIYKQHIPLVNAAYAPGVWQTYDIIFRAPVFGTNGRLKTAAVATVLHNGVLVQNHVSLSGPTEFVGAPNYQAHGAAPIKLQDHSNPVSFRNIWARHL